MRGWSPASLRLKFLIFSISASLTLGGVLGVAWLFFQVGVINQEILFDDQARRRQIQSILADELKEGKHSPVSAAQHIGRAFFPGKDIIIAEITTPRGVILASKNKGEVGRESRDADDIRKAVRLNEALLDFWVLRRPGDLEGKQKISGLTPFNWQPTVQEFTAPVIIRGRPELALHVYVSLDRFIASLRRLVFIAASIILSVSSVFAAANFFILNRLVIRPILALERSAERIAAGDTNTRAEVTRRDELGALAARFNAMMDKLIYARFQADTDSLTGLFNYRHLQGYLATQINSAKRYNRNLTVAMLDIDHFKRVNDLFGHQTGDDVLRMTVNFIKGQLREADYMARYGGEEFVVAMPETDAKAAVKVMNRILKGFPENVFVEGKDAGGTLFLSVSIGLADFPYCGEDVTNLLAGADMALLLSKRRGRNRLSYARLLNREDAG